MPNSKKIKIEASIADLINTFYLQKVKNMIQCEYKKTMLLLCKN